MSGRGGGGGKDVMGRGGVGSICSLLRESCFNLQTGVREGTRAHKTAGDRA